MGVKVELKAMIDRLAFQPAIAGITDVAIAALRGASQPAPVSTQSGNGAGTSTDMNRGGAQSQAQFRMQAPVADPDRPTGPPPTFEANVLDARAAELRQGYARAAERTAAVSQAAPRTPTPADAATQAVMAQARALLPNTANSPSSGSGQAARIPSPIDGTSQSTDPARPTGDLPAAQGLPRTAPRTAASQAGGRGDAARPLPAESAQATPTLDDSGASDIAWTGGPAPAADTAPAQTAPTGRGSEGGAPAPVPTLPDPVAEAPRNAPAQPVVDILM